MLNSCESKLWIFSSSETISHRTSHVLSTNMGKFRFKGGTPLACTIASEGLVVNVHGEDSPSDSKIKFKSW